MNCVPQCESTTSLPRTILVQVYEPLPPVNTYEVYRRFTYILHIIRSWLPTGLRLPELTSPHGSVSTGLHLSGFVVLRCFPPYRAVPGNAGRSRKQTAVCLVKSRSPLFHIKIGDFVSHITYTLNG